METEDVVSVMAGNRPEMLAAHYAIPAEGAVLNPINTRLDSETVGWILQHSESKLLLCDEHSSETAEKAAESAGIPIQVFSENGSSGLDILHGANVNLTDISEQIKDEWAPIALNYTSGTTDNPKGVFLHHRGAYLNSPGEYYGLGIWKIDKISLDTFHVSLRRMVSHLGDNHSRRNSCLPGSY